MTSRSISRTASLRRSATVVLLTLALIATGCGGSDDAAEVATATDDVAADAGASTTSDFDANDTSILEDTEGGDVQVVNSGTPVDLFEWGLAAPAIIDSGEVLFSITNSGSFNHELAIARGTSYESLPLLANGAVDEAALGADFIGRTETFGGGITIEQPFLLEPGDYVFFCNIAVGPNSHAANGQVQSVTVG